MTKAENQIETKDKPMKSGSAPSTRLPIKSRVARSGYILFMKEWNGESSAKKNVWSTMEDSEKAEWDRRAYMPK